ncbi:MAG TPA: hypothetical protein VHX38_31775 [Pseudonocardiaceae bacterium]|jgi:hypothetical protein|nr:hypothetical protein [Pseudonocardiaceae bacterium]
MGSLFHININKLPWPLLVSVLAVLISLVSVTFTVLTYRRGRPNVKVTMKLIDLLPYGQRTGLPSSIGISLTVTNCGSAATTIDDIIFRFKAIVSHPCVPDEWTTQSREEFEPVSLGGYSSFRRTIHVPLALPKDAKGDPSLTAEVTLGTDETIATGPREIRESIFAHWRKRIDAKLDTGST